MADNIVIYLIGYPGTGKLTIAKEICKRRPDVKLVDNHLINNPILSVIEQDGRTPLPQRVWDNVGQVWTAVLDTMVTVSPKHFSFVLTNVLLEKNKDDHSHFKRIQKMAAERNAVFVPVLLTCAVEELARRIVSPERRERMKDINAETPARLAQRSPLIPIDHENCIDLDVTDLAPDAAADIILKKASSIKAG